MPNISGGTFYDFAERSAADVPAAGVTRVQRSAGSMVALQSDGSLSLLGGGIGWLYSSAFPNAAAAIGATNIKSFRYASFDVNNDATASGANPPTLITTEDGGVYQFPGPGQGQIAFPGQSLVIANAKASTWFVQLKMKLVDTPTSATISDWINVSNGGQALALELNGPGSALVPDLVFNNGVTTRQATTGLIGGNIPVGAYFDAAVGCVGNQAITAYINGLSIGTRTDMANCPTVASFVIAIHAAGAQRWNVADMFVAFGGPQ